MRYTVCTITYDECYDYKEFKSFNKAKEYAEEMAFREDMNVVCIDDNEYGECTPIK